MSDLEQELKSTAVSVVSSNRDLTHVLRDSALSSGGDIFRTYWKLFVNANNSRHRKYYEIISHLMEDKKLSDIPTINDAITELENIIPKEKTIYNVLFAPLFEYSESRIPEPNSENETLWNYYKEELPRLENSYVQLTKKLPSLKERLEKASTDTEVTKICSELYQEVNRFYHSFFSMFVMGRTFPFEPVKTEITNILKEYYTK